MNLRTVTLSGTLAAALLAGGSAAIASQASAGPPVVSTQTVVKTLTSPKCYHRHSDEWIYMHYSSKANGRRGGYVNYVKPTHRTEDSTTCHA